MTKRKPDINVSPFIDILLVLLIIFMVISPLKPASFKAKVPREPKKNDEPIPHIHTLVVAVSPDSSLALNREIGLGTVAEPQKLTEKLSEIFRARTENRVYDENLAFRNDLSEDEKILKTVFIKAPRLIPYGEVAKVVDAVKLAGANPIGLQIDGLD